MEDVMRRLTQRGLHLKADFLASVSNAQSTAAAVQEETIFAHFLETDMNLCGSGCLPPDLSSQHNTTMKGRYILQIDEVANMAACAKQRYEGGTQKRCLKLCLTDGQQRAYAFEYQSIPTLQTLCPAGLKIAVVDVAVKQGLLALRPQNVFVLGGKVERLEAARCRMVERWSRPVACTSGREPSGRNLFQEASASAWDEPSSSTQEQARALAPHVEPNPPRSSNNVQDSTGIPDGRAAMHNAPQNLGPPAPAAESIERDASQSVALDRRHTMASAVSCPIETITLDSPAAAADASDVDSWGDQTGTAQPGPSNQAVSADGYLSEESRPPANAAPACWSRNMPQAGTPTAAPGAAAGADMEHTCSSAGMDAPEQPFTGCHLSSPGITLTSLSQMENLVDVFYPVVVKMHGHITGLASRLLLSESAAEPHHSFTLDVAVEDSTSGHEHVVTLSDYVISSILGMSAADAFAARQQGQVREYQERLSVLKQYLRDFVGFMIINVAALEAKSLVVNLELDSH